MTSSGFWALISSLWSVLTSGMLSSEKKTCLQDFTSEKSKSGVSELLHWQNHRALGHLTLDAVTLCCRPPSVRTASQIAANVCWEQPTAAASLPTRLHLPPSACLSTNAVAIPEPACHSLQPALQRQPDGPQPHQLEGLHPGGLLPAADRTHQRGCHTRPRRPFAVCCEGAGVLCRGPEGTSETFDLVEERGGYSLTLSLHFYQSTVESQIKHKVKRFSINELNLKLHVNTSALRLTLSLTIYWLYHSLWTHHLFHHKLCIPPPAPEH